VKVWVILRTVGCYPDAITDVFACHEVEETANEIVAELEAQHEAAQQIPWPPLAWRFPEPEHRREERTALYKAVEEAREALCPLDARGASDDVFYEVVESPMLQAGMKTLVEVDA
jgi:hypothetical protein